MIYWPSSLIWKSLMSFKLFRQLVSILSISLLVACVNTPQQTGNHEMASPAITQNINVAKQTRILLVNTNQKIDRYKTAENAFIKTLGDHNLQIVDLGNDNYPIDTLQDLLNNQEFDAIYCIGAKALGSVDYIDPETPIIYSSVLNWRKFDTQQGRYNGIASEVAPKAQLAWFKYFFPKIKKIGVFYSSENVKRLQDATLTAKALSLELITQEINSEIKLEQQANDLLAKVDVLWLISDPGVIASTDQTKDLFKLADQLETPIFTYHSFFMGMGATLSITADLPTTGIQAALMMKKILNQADYKQAIQFPAGSSITLNIQKVEAYKLNLNQNALDSVDELIEH